MPFISPGSRKGGRLLGALVGAAMCLMLPATASAGVLDVLKPDRKAALNLLDCRAEHDLGTPFLPWDDDNLYAKAPNGDFEAGGLGGGWTGAGVTIVRGNEPWYIGSRSDSRSLRISGKSSATSPAMCIDATFPFFRFFAQNLGKTGSLDVYVTYLTRDLKAVERRAGSVRSDDGAWFVSPPMEIDVDFGSQAGAAAPVSFRFDSSNGADWRIDDLYVDPFARR